jgi:putative membrane protein
VEPSLALAGQRTRLAFQRTRLGADRTLMATMRTSLSLIGFGFTVFQFLARAHELTHATRWISVGLVIVGFACQALGIWKHVDFGRELRAEADVLVKEQLLEQRPRPAHQVTLVVALALLLVGLAATVTVIVQALVT